MSELLRRCRLRRLLGHRSRARAVSLLVCLAVAAAATTTARSIVASDATGDESRIAWFSADVTVPIGHRLMGVLPVKSRTIADPLEARGFVLSGKGSPIVVVSVDWCEIRNDSYDRWREAIARAAKTTPERVILSANHQHDAPVVDLGAEALLASVGLSGELCDVDVHDQALAMVCAAIEEALPRARRTTHVGIGRARVREIASNRRVVDAKGRVAFSRGSRS